MDAWIHEADAFGIELGDAHIIRNAGGSAIEALRSLIISQRVLDTNQIMLVKHTRTFAVLASVCANTANAPAGCGMAGITNATIHATVKKNHEICVDHIDFLPFEECVSRSLFSEYLLTRKQPYPGRRGGC